ncbi:sodium-coupled monocarboxylate transporter 1-like [Lutzomyia longipalpis]|uniref:sodium-coupled monocarboxylate transporter 1-like n=1 Tax=Lutzomyia longipalpis TaxID=7200 RepID=UPI00248381FA|nr:sodium-coupled monocarboxylate transporter 1-like [Lutzomyia longipalpis]
MIGLGDIESAFGAIDYSLVFLTLAISIGIGIYHGLRNRKNTDELEYLMAGKKLSVIPVGISLFASKFSALTLVGFSTEMYVYGSSFTFLVLTVLLTAYIFSEYVLPVFHAMEITSMYQYLEMRFDRRVRLFGSGGYRATIWTDVFQAIIMIGSVVVVMALGYINMSKDIGFMGIFQKTYEAKRFEFPTLTPDPTIRNSFWSLYFGGIWIIMYTFCNQPSLQRFLSLPTLPKAKKACWFYGCLIWSIFAIGFFGGTILTAFFSSCDPKSAGMIQANDQILPFFVVLLNKSLPGLSGIFIGGMFSAALSSISTLLNSLAAVTLEDFCKTFYRGNLTARSKSIIMRSVVVVFGLLPILFLSIIEKSDTINQFGLSTESICTLIGGVCSLALVGWISFSANAAIGAKELVFATKPFNTSGCQEMFNVTVASDLPSSLASGLTVAVAKSDVMFLHRISYLYYPAIGVITTILMAFIAKLFLGGNAPDSVDASLIWRSEKSSKDNSLPKSPSDSVTTESTDLLINYSKEYPIV